MLMVMPASRLTFFHLYAICYFLLPYHLPHDVVAGAAASPLSFSFDFSNISSYRIDDLRFEGSATLDGGLVDLTCNTPGRSKLNCIGRMSYNHPLRFYDTTTGDVASFSTRFNFMIGFPGKTAGDGMAFFLSSYPSMLPANSTGGNLGLHSGDGINAEGKNRIVAVEFDTYKNLFDPSSNHIGIDINTVHASVNTTSVDGTMNGSMVATITFNSSTRMLVASLHFDDQPSRGSYQVSTQLPNPVKDLLPSEVAVGFSAATGLNFEDHQIMSWSFNSTLVRKDNRKLVIGVATIGSVVVGPVLVWFILSFYRWRRTRDSFVKEITRLRRLEYNGLAAATRKFSKVNTLGKGAFGAVYKGSYTDENGKQEVAVKKIKKLTIGEARDFMAEIQTISVTRHTNLIELKGWCCTREIWNLIDLMCWCRQQRVKLFLVYELMPNGTLEDHLHHMERTLPWEKRYQIVKGIGSALCYLHHECNRFIFPHRDIKTSNILLDYDFNAKLTDVALSMLASQSNATLLTNARTVGYMDQECMTDGDFESNSKTDVYNFGIALLEIACRKTRAQVLEWYRSSAERWMVEAADEKLNGVFDETQMERVIVLALKCSQAKGKQRPYMKDAMKFLEDGVELPAITEIEGQQNAAASTSAIELGATDPWNMNHDSVISPRRLSYDFLQGITDGFSEERKCGRGTYGEVYWTRNAKKKRIWGVTTDGKKIAVKKLYNRPWLADNDKQFDKEFQNLTCLQHPNIVRFVGYCHETHREYLPYNEQMVLADVTKRALCFEYMHNGGLDKFLYDEFSGHDWDTRYAIIKGICEGLKYLHEELQPPILHLDLKPANILLDKDMVPKLADFGLSRLFGEERTQITTTDSIGTRGYVPPEFINDHKISNKFDIFSLGVVIMKIMTGREGYSKCCEMASHDFIDLVHENWRRRLHAKSACALESYPEQVKRCMQIALSCVDDNRHQRPSIGDIVSKLNDTEAMINQRPTIGDRIMS